MNLYLSIEAIKRLMHYQYHCDFNPHSIGSLIKEFKPHLSYSDVCCASQVKRHLYEGEDSVVNLLINLRPEFLDGMADNPPPTMRQIKQALAIQTIQTMKTMDATAA